MFVQHQPSPTVVYTTARLSGIYLQFGGERARYQTWSTVRTKQPSLKLSFTMSCINVIAQPPRAPKGPDSPITLALLIALVKTWYNIQSPSKGATHWDRRLQIDSVNKSPSWQIDFGQKANVLNTWLRSYMVTFVQTAKMLNWYSTSNLPYSSELWTVRSYMKNGPEAKE